ncbi:MAG: preprotein translocase subunit YajC [Chloroflexi bacterium]|jgi:preprotein translocase subunit YajC|nr:preprotein translocase subunit YajC [Chloroflexota bacterium]|tara:strand:+ start:902 stop:1195 length:294 start_codon:yes stop_codon:yes gene_type:complete
MEQSTTFFDPTLFLLFGFMILIYFLMIRPENKRRKTHQEMLASIEVGNEVVTAGGILGKVSKISDQYIELSISDSTKIKVQKTSISTILPKGTLKAI